MPNGLLKIDPFHALFFNQDLDQIKIQMLEAFCPPVWEAIETVTGITPDDVEIEAAQFGPRKVGKGGTLLPVNLHIRALERTPWQGKYAWRDGTKLTKWKAVEMLACEGVVQALATTQYPDLNFDIKLEVMTGAYGTGDQARARLNAVSSDDH